MGFSERSAQRKQARDLRADLKQIKKQALAAGCDKNEINSFLKELESIIESGRRLSKEYSASK